MSTEEATTSAPPVDLPADPVAFWGDVPADLVPAEPVVQIDIPVLDQLGAAPFKKLEKGGFPFLGFLASVFEHVSTTAVSELHPSAGVIGPTQG